MFASDEKRVLPTYIERGGEQVYAPPFKSQNVQLYGFVFALQNDDLTAAQETVDAQLNAPTKGATDYRVATPFVLVTFAQMGPLRSLVAPDSDKGFFEYDEAAIWMLTMATEEKHGAKKVDRLAWFIPYMFAELSQAVCCGREIYGYPKQYGWIGGVPDSVPDGVPNDVLNDTTSSTRIDNMTLSTVAIRNYGADSRAQKQQLFNIRRVDTNENESEFAREWENIEEAFVEMVKLLRVEGGLPHPSFDFVLHLLEYALHREAPMVYLKQFRDVQDSTSACYQAIIEAPGKVEKVHRVALLHGDYELEIAPADSHPIASDLGLALQQKALLGFYVDFDLGIELGHEVWRAA